MHTPVDSRSLSARLKTARASRDRAVDARNALRTEIASLKEETVFFEDAERRISELIQNLDEILLQIYTQFGIDPDGLGQ